MLVTEWEFKVRFAETDAAGIVFYPNYYKWMDQATHEMFSGIGFSTKKLLAEHAGIPLVEAFCQFRKPVFFEDNMKAVSVVREVRNKVIKISHSFYRDEELIAEGYEIRAWINGTNGQLKAESIPHNLRQALSADQGNE